MTTTAIIKINNTFVYYAIIISDVGHGDSEYSTRPLRVVRTRRGENASPRVTVQIG